MTGVGLCVPQLGEHATPAAFTGFCREAERLGYTSLWVQDHFMWPLQPSRGYAGRPGLAIPQQYQSVMAPLELLAAASMLTTKALLGTSVLVQGNHWPAPLAQQLATIDQLSGGRLVVGLGQGWNAEEHHASGTSVTTRAARMEEFVAALRACWADDPISFDGEIFSITPAIQRPKPVQRPHPPLLSGASSPAGIERTVRLFDGWNPAGIPVAQVAATAAAINAQRPADRSPLDVYYRTFVQFLGPAAPAAEIVDTMARDVRAASAAGFREFIIEHNFWDEITSPADWLAVPEQFLPVLRAAQDA